MTTTSTTVELRHLTGTIGSEVVGVDLRTDLAARDVDAIRAALVDRKVLVFRGQHLDADELVRFGRRFGELTAAHPVLTPLDDDHPEVLAVDATRSRLDARYRDEYEQDSWHGDVTFMPNPPLGSVLAAVHLPPAGGDTVFADLQAAYESLSPGLRAYVDGLEAEHDGSSSFARFLATNPEGGTWDGRRFTVLEPVRHPVVRTHPETGRRGLFVNPTFTTRIVGVPKRESDHLLRFLYDHIAAPEHQVRQRWTSGDVVFWDNRSTVHIAVRDYGQEHRLLHRVTLRGDRPA